MLKDNVDAAVRARAAYMILESDVQRLKDVADAASRYQAEAEEVQASLDIVAFSLNQMLETVTAPGMEDLTNTAS